MEPAVKSESRGSQISYSLTGEWTVDYAEKCLRATQAIESRAGGHTVVQCGGLTRIDITGAWLLNRRIDTLQHSGARISLQGFRPEHLTFLERVGSLKPHPRMMIAPRHPLLARLARLAERVPAGLLRSAIDAVSFLGWCLISFFRTLLYPKRFRFSAFVKQCEMAAVRAVPIVALISFLIAIVTAYQGAAQLKRFGAEIFTINLVTISVLREMGVLLTAIMLAGRSGSAFAAEIGTMKLNEEIDALVTTGLDPMDALVLPRILALAVMMPLLTFLADMAGFLGSGVLNVTTNHTTWLLYQSRLTEVIRMGDFWVGMSKAPVFGLLIGMIGCYHGLKVTNSAESVGKETTNAVVTSIFFVMMTDAVFSIIYTKLGL